jgi:hypothetical protein
LLVPSDALTRTLAELGSLGSASDPAIVVHLQRHFGVSYGTMLMRLRQGKLITPSTYKELGTVSPSRLAEALGYDVSPADLGDYSMPVLERFPERVLWAVRSAILQGYMTRGDAAETLGVSIEDILRLLDRPAASPHETRELSELEQVAGFR